MAAQDKPAKSDKSPVLRAAINSSAFLSKYQPKLRLTKYICTPNRDGISATVVCTYEKV